MLGIEDFAKQVQDKLNAIASVYEGAIPFKIYTNLGDYVQAYRVLNDVEQYQFGIMRVLPSEIVPVKGLSVQNLVIQVEFGVEIDKSELDDNGNYLQVVYTQQILNNYAQSTTGTTETIEGLDSKNYTVAYSINPCTVGSVTMTSSDKGEVLPVQITIDVSAVENGVNLNDIDVFIDGEAVYPLSIQATRKRIPNENSFSNKTSTSVGMLQNGFGLDMIVPALYNELGETILDDIYIGKDNIAHEVRIRNDKYLVYYVANSDNSGAEPRYAFYKKEQKKLTYKVTVTSPKLTVIINGSTGLTAGYSIDWGDNTAPTQGNVTKHTYSQAGTYEIEFIAGALGSIENQVVPKEYCYIMTFGNTNHNTSANNTITPTISLVEGVPYVLDYSDKWEESTNTYTEGQTETISGALNTNKVIFWGDGTYTVTSNSIYDTYYHTYKAGTYTRRIFTRS